MFRLPSTTGQNLGMCTTKGRAQQPLLRNGESAPCYFLKSACSVNDYLDIIPHRYV
nr:MAG TPA: hypothetical protein [Caudoviricetes sp.]